MHGGRSVCPIFDVGRSGIDRVLAVHATYVAPAALERESRFERFCALHNESEATLQKELTTRGFQPDSRNPP
eukprot:7191946-Pyramimonas_sp.AAC.1